MSNGIFIYANKAKTEERYFCLKRLKNEIHACKTREEIASISFNSFCLKHLNNEMHA